MNIREYLEQAEKDSDVWWGLSGGTQLNLFDKALEVIEELQDKIEELERKIYELSGNTGELDKNPFTCG